MKKIVMAAGSLAAIGLLATVCLADMKKGAKIDGGAEFKKHCAACHPDGGNIINPKKTLKKADLAKSGIKDWKGIMKAMRSPGPGMTKFDAKTIPDKEAKAIGDYVLKTYK